MPCDGKNPNCERRRELLSQLKCLVASMDQKKPCEWDEPACNPPITCSPANVQNREPTSYCVPVKACKSYEFRSSMLHRCECIKRNGLQDQCMFLDCMGRPECMTKLFPVCYPGRAALVKLTDLGDTRVALEKFYCADQARESALAAYCRLVCPENTNGTQCSPPLFVPAPSSLTPICGSAQPSSNQLHTHHYSPLNHNGSQNSYSSPADSQVQQQLHRQPIQRCQQQQQYQQQQQPPQWCQRQYQPQPRQHYQQQYQQQIPQYCQQQYRQQQPMPYSYSSSQTSNMLHAQQC